MLCAPAQAGVALLYHHVDESTPAVTSISPQQFERHLDIIIEEGFEVLPLDQFLDRSRHSPADARIVTITFDDAYQSIYHTAWPLLAARDMPFTLFVATDLVQANHPLYLSWQQLREMAAGGAHIANHSHSHAHLVRRLEAEDDTAWRKRVRAEITTASEQLRAQQLPSDYFAYPYGEYNLELLGILASLGMAGFGQQSGAIGPASNTLMLPRFPLAGNYVEETAFRDKLRSLAMPVQHPLIDPVIVDETRPPLPLRFTDSAVTVSRLTCYGPGGLMAIAETGRQAVVATPQAPVPVGRSRYNCTLPATEGRFYWFSQLWMRKKDDGTWYPEP